jgi:hypothetical protein
MGLNTVRQWGKLLPLDFSKYKRVVCWFSCGATSAVATKMALDLAYASGLPCVAAYCDTGAEHDDNVRFMRDCADYLDFDITVLRGEYPDTWAVWEARQYIAGVNGAPCTTALKKQVREAFEQDGDLQVFGFDVSEIDRALQFAANQPEVALWCPLLDAGISKQQCFEELAGASIALPAMYMLGYRNNNCIGCPKGNAGYWNKIRRDFPIVFDRMADLEERVGAKLCQQQSGGVRKRVTLRELRPDAGVYSDEPPIVCGLLCDQGV